MGFRRDISKDLGSTPLKWESKPSDKDMELLEEVREGITEKWYKHKVRKLIQEIDEQHLVWLLDVIKEHTENKKE